MTQIPEGPSDMYCPMWRKKMSSVCKTCPLWVKHTTVDVRTQMLSDNWGCSLALAPRLMLETARNSEGVRRAVESFRNEMVAQNQHLLENAARKLLEGEDHERDS